MTLKAAIVLGYLSLATAWPASAAEVAPGDPDYSIYTKPQRLVEVEPGRRLNLVCLGEGSPTVVFDVGAGDPAGDWSLVQPQVARFTRACAYDRAGIGFSDAGTGNGSSAEIVADLRRLLSAASITPPYLFVGQSYGAMNVRLYHYLHPEEVVGLVLVEPAHEDQDEGFRMLSPRALTRAEWVAGRDPGRVTRDKCIDAASRGVSPTSDEFSGCVVPAPLALPEPVKVMYEQMQYGEKFQRAQGTEETAVYAESVEQLRAHRRGFGDLPVIVLSRSAEDRPLRDWETARLRQSRYQFWLDLHRGQADASNRGEHRIIPDSDHLLMLSQPEAVVSAVRDVLALAMPKDAELGFAKPGSPGGLPGQFTALDGKRIEGSPVAIRVPAGKHTIEYTCPDTITMDAYPTVKATFAAGRRYVLACKANEDGVVSER